MAEGTPRWLKAIGLLFVIGLLAYAFRYQEVYVATREAGGALVQTVKVERWTGRTCVETAVVALSDDDPEPRVLADVCY